MTALELYELVKPLIGTEWEPEGLNTVTMIYCAPGEELQSPVCLPVPAARAMWEVALTGWPRKRARSTAEPVPGGG